MKKQRKIKKPVPELKKKDFPNMEDYKRIIEECRKEFLKAATNNNLLFQWLRLESKKKVIE